MFSKKQWQHFKAATCKQCALGGTAAHETKTCAGPCKKKLAADMFSKKQWQRFKAATCKQCALGGSAGHETKTCSGPCNKQLVEDMFSKKQWLNFNEATCKQCIIAHKSLMSCGRCQLSKFPSEFTKCEKATPSYMKKAAKRRCNSCLDEHEQKLCQSLTKDDLRR